MIDIKNITYNLSKHQVQLNSFLNSLNSELDFFKLDINRIKNSESVFIVTIESKIIGVAGFERKYYIIRPYLLVKKDYQGKQIGKRALLHLLDEAKKKHKIFMALIDGQNIPSLNLFIKIGFELAGKKDNLHYLIYSFNNRGKFLYYLIKTMFPILKIVDIFRI